jgi:hypothetical protein
LLPHPRAEKRESLGVVNVYAPTDWFDLLADGDNIEAARARCAHLIDRSYPTREASQRRDLTDALMAWREVLFDQGVIMHGMVTWPGDDEIAVWQVIGGVVDVPTGDADLDLAEVMARHLGQDLGDTTAHVESFPTAMGLGLGIISQPTQTPEGDFEIFPRDPADVQGGEHRKRIGMAAALACPPGGGYGLLVTGNCLDPEQAVMLAGLVGVIASRSTMQEGTARRADVDGVPEG